MFEQFMPIIKVLVNAAVLCLILYIVAKNEDDYSFSKAAIIVVGIVLGSFLIHTFLKLGWYNLIINYAFSAMIIYAFGWFDIRKSIVVILIFCTAQLGVTVGGKYIKENFMTVEIPSSQLQATAQEWKNARKKLKYSGTMLNSSGENIAIVNGDIVEVGDIISHTSKKATYRWTVSKISKHNIEYKQLDLKKK